MHHRIYSPNQLEKAAELLLTQFDPKLLKEPKFYDVYSVIEKCLGVEYDWKYIRPDQSVLGLTAFNAGYFWVSPTPYFYEGIQPQKIYLEKGTILIDSTLAEGGNIGRERFTVMHEVFHQVLHKDNFRRVPLIMFMAQPPKPFWRKKAAAHLAGHYRISGECLCCCLSDAAQNAARCLAENFRLLHAGTAMCRDHKIHPGDSSGISGLQAGNDIPAAQSRHSHFLISS